MPLLGSESFGRLSRGLSGHSAGWRRRLAISPHLKLPRFRDGNRRQQLDRRYVTRPGSPSLAEQWAEIERDAKAFVNQTRRCRMKTTRR